MNLDSLVLEAKFSLGQKVSVRDDHKAKPTILKGYEVMDVDVKLDPTPWSGHYPDRQINLIYKLRNDEGKIIFANENKIIPEKKGGIVDV